MRIFFLVLLVFFSSFDDPKLTKLRMYKTISALAPENFRVMTDDEMASKYLTYRKPTAMFTNPENTVSFGLNISASTWNYKDLALLQSFYKSSIRQIYTDLDMIKEEIKEINGKKYIIFEFLGDVADDKETIGDRLPKPTYNYLQYTVHENNILIFNFTCAVRHHKKWQKTAEKMMNGISL